MTTQNTPDGASPNDRTAAAATSVAETPGQSAGGQTAPVDTDALLHAFESLKAENADLKDRLLRAHAEMDNVRKRLEREKTDAHKYAVSKLAKDLVVVGDNFQRAIESVPAEAIEQAPALKSLVEGVTMTERELLSALERHGIRRIDPKGQLFNPHHHQAVMEQPNPDVPSGTITQVFQCGYMIEDRVLRPAMVVVAKGGSKPIREPGAPPPQPGPAAAGDDAASGAGGPQN